MKRNALLATVAIGLAMSAACQRSTPESSDESSMFDRVPAPAVAPAYAFDPGVCTDREEICAFLRGFLESCLAGDYSEYRRLLSRSQTPLARERFQAIYYAVRSVTVRSIEPVRAQRLGDPAYLVISSVEFDPEQRVRLRRSDRDFAILVYQEAGEWRFIPAPASLQPASQPATDDEPAPESQPSYPWAEGRDY